MSTGTRREGTASGVSVRAASRAVRRPAPSALALLVLVSLLVLLALTVALPVALAQPVPAPGAAVEPQEPPVVVGLTLPEATKRVQEGWYPDLVGLEPSIVVTSDLPDGVPPEEARVVEQRVVQYLAYNPDKVLTAVLDVTVGSFVPDLVGSTQDEAQERVDRARLVLDADGTGVVRRQKPPARTLLPFGSRVSAVLVPPATRTPTSATSPPVTATPSVPPVEPPDDGTDPAAVLAAAGGAGLVAAVAIGLWMLRSPRTPKPPAAEVTVRARPDADPAVSVHHGAPDLDLVLRVVPGADAGLLTVTRERA